MLGGVPRRLALKVVQASGSPDAGSAVLREAQALSAFRHRNLMSSLAAWQTPPDGDLAGAVVFLLPLAELSLADYLRDRTAGGYGPCDTAATCMAAAGIGSALAYLHRSPKPDGSGPVVHNDVKPENLLQVGGTWLLGDLGIASPPGREGVSARAGSLPYLAPEYLADARCGKHPAGDVWALGVVLHEWLTGDFPFPGETPRERAQAVREGIEPRLEVTDPAIRALISAMIAREPDNRPSAAEVSRRLRAAAGQRERRLGVRPVTAAIALAVLAVGGAGGAFAYAAISPSTKTVLRFASYGTARSLVPGQTVPVLVQPRLKAPVLARLADGAPAGIVCTMHGDTIRGNWGQTSLWDRISYGGQAVGWISDGLLY
jgi:serine/threonine-protein kinase